MTFPEFGRVLEEDSFPEFGRVLEERPSKKETVSEKASRNTKAGVGGKAFSRGLLKTGGSLLDLLVPKVSSERYPEERFSFEEAAEKMIPRSSEEGFGERTIERGAGILPFLLGGEAGLGAKLGRSALAALLGQSTEELGGGPVLQAIAEIGGLGAPGLAKKIVPTQSQKKGVEMLRRRGLSEKEIAPLIPSKRKSSGLSKLGTRGYRTKTAAKRTQDALGNIYAALSEEGEKLPILSSKRAESLKNELLDKLNKMPSAVRRAAQEDVQDLFNKPIQADSLMNFWQDLNSQINWKSIKGGKKKLNALKSSLLEGLQDISPELAEDFELTNQFYGKFKNLYRNLQPESLDRWMALGETGLLIGGLFKYGPKGIIPFIGSEGARRLSSEMLVNPRLQNLTKQMTRALNQNKIGVARQIQAKIEKELESADSTK